MECGWCTVEGCTARRTNPRKKKKKKKKGILIPKLFILFIPESGLCETNHIHGIYRCTGMVLVSVYIRSTYCRCRYFRKVILACRLTPIPPWMFQFRTNHPQPTNPRLQFRQPKIIPKFRIFTLLTKVGVTWTVAIYYWAS